MKTTGEIERAIKLLEGTSASLAEINDKRLVDVTNASIGALHWVLSSNEEATLMVEEMMRLGRKREQFLSALSGFDRN